MSAAARWGPGADDPDAADASAGEAGAGGPSAGEASLAPTDAADAASSRLVDVEVRILPDDRRGDARVARLATPTPHREAASPPTHRLRPSAPRGTVRLPGRHRRRGRQRQLPPRVAQVADLLRRFGPIAAVVAAYLLSALIVPTMTPALVGDDWVYVRSVEILLRQGRLEVLDLSVVTLLFQVAWGALFAALFGLSFGVLRVSTVVIVALAGIAVYALCRELGVDRGWSALGAAAYLFNPLAYVLSFTFMSDPHFAALLAIATWAYARALRPDRPSARLLWAASALAALAFLVRQQGALVPPAMLLALLAQGRLRLDRPGLRTSARVALVPAATIIAYYLWLFFVRGVPEQQASFAAKIVSAGWDEAALLAGRMAFVVAIYLGFLALPVVVAALGRPGRWLRTVPWSGWAVAIAWVGMLAAGIAHFAEIATPPPLPRMPYIAQYVGPNGLGPTDLQGGRPWLVGWRALDGVTAVAAAASLAYALLLLRALPRPLRLRPPDPTRATAGVVLAIAGGQALGILPPSFHFRNWLVSVDRYLLPLLPLALGLGLWALRGLRARPFGAWVVVAAFALVSIAGTRDLLVFQGATWDLARAAVQLGVPLTRLDAGAAWDGYHLYEYSVANAIPTQTPGGPWWTDLFAPATDSSYVVATAVLPGYDAIGTVSYSSWLADAEQPLFLLRRQGVTGPP